MAANYSIEVTGITVTGVAKDGIYTVGADTPWAKNGEATTTLTFGTATVAGGTTTPVAASETHQILPVEQTLAVTIAYDINYKGTKVASTTKSGNIPAKTYLKNTVYNITAEIDAKKIEFSVHETNGVGAWGDSDEAKVQ